MKKKKTFFFPKKLKKLKKVDTKVSMQINLIK
jgi:hypothetical protein